MITTIFMRVISVLGAISAAALLEACGGTAPASAPASASPSPVVLPGAAANPPAGTTITVTSPKSGESVPAGDVTVAFETPIDLVPGSQAKNFNDYHAHALLDVDATPYLGTDLPVPGASPAPAVEGIIHTGAKTVTFPNVAPGSHQVVVFLSFANHASLKPAISDAVTFTAE